MNAFRCRQNDTLGRRGVNGYSLLEVLVVIGVISLLLALMIPAVQFARGAAHSTQCRNHLRQLSYAAQNYNATFGVFPTRRFLKEVRPWLEVHEEARTVAIFGCPSDLQNATGDAAEGKVSYGLNAGLGSDENRFSGIVSSVKRYIRAAEVVDGLSNTAMIGEKLSFPWYAPQVVDWNERRHEWNRTFLFFRDSARNPSEFRKACSQPGLRPISTWFVNDVYHHLMTPNSRSCTRVNEDGLLVPGGFGSGAMAASLHSGGAFIAFADGSVHFVSSNIDTEIWSAQGTRSGGEVF
jgi:prepilin-type N-terminal cleavage/methylation domain-containing protein/prepilin-type processing-associated H-X9-DG protein